MRAAIHQAPEEFLLDFAAGTLSPAQSVVLASHAELCERARASLHEFEAVGGAMLEHLPPVAMAPDSLDALMAKLDALGEAAEAAEAPEAVDIPAPPSETAVPQALAAYLPASFDGLPWRSVTRALSEYEIDLGGGGEATDGAKLRLLRIAPGAEMPQHTHSGEELTLVLEGGFTDAGKDFIRGDLAVAGPEADHQPVAHEGVDCICLVATTAGLKLTGPVGRFLNPFLRF